MNPRWPRLPCRLGFALACGLLASRAIAQSDYATPFAFTTLAGNPGTATEINSPAGVAFDAAGNVYVANTGDNTIRRVAPGGAVTILAGSPGLTGSADGPGSTARFNGPRGVAVDGVGNVYVADTGNEIIREISPAGVVTTLAGAPGQSGDLDGPGGSACLFNPEGVAVDSLGNLYVADTGNNAVREITPAGVVSTLAGLDTQSPYEGSGSSGAYADGTGTAARFNNPTSVAVDGAGNVYVADALNDTIRKIAPGRVVTTLAGSFASDADGNATGGSADGTGSAAQFNIPTGVAVDGAGNVYVADWGNETVRQITSGGVVTTLAGAADQVGSVNGAGIASRFCDPTALAVDGAGNVYVADTGNSLIRRITADGAVTTFAGAAPGSADGAGAAAQFNDPKGMAIDGVGNVYVTDTDNDTIREITSAGVVTTRSGTPGLSGSTDGSAGAALFNHPSGVALDRAGNLYVADAGNNTIRRISTAGLVTTLAGKAGQAGSDDGAGGAASFSNPAAVAVDGAGNVYVADCDNNEIRKVTPAGIVTTLVAGSGGLDDPQGVALDSAGNVYVASSGNGSIEKVTPAGVVTVFAGIPFVPGSADGDAITARFDHPGSLAVDGAGFVYVTDSGNDTIRVIAPTGTVTTLAGTAGLSGISDGTGAAALFNQPQGIAVDAADNVYVADTDSSTIRRGSPGPASVPSIESQPQNEAVWTGGTVQFTVLAGGVPNPTCQWQVSTNGGATWTNLSDGNGVAGSSSPTLTLSDAGAGLNGNQFECVLANSAGSATTPPAVLSVNPINPYAITTLAGTTAGSADGSGGAAQFNSPGAVAVDGAGNLYVADTDNETIRKIEPGGSVTTLAGLAGQAGFADGAGAAARFSQPCGVALDSGGNLYVADTGNGTIREISPSGDVTTLAGGQPGHVDGVGSAAGFIDPEGIAVDGTGNLYVSDYWITDGTIRKVAPTTVDGVTSWVVTTLAGTPPANPESVEVGSADGTGGAAQFYQPWGVGVDGAGNIYVADSGNCTIRKITPGGVVTTLAGTALATGSADGTGAGAHFDQPEGVAVDGAGDIFVTDALNGTLREIKPSGAVATLAGAPGEAGTADGTGSAARFSKPGGIAVDAAGNLYIADTGNNAIRKGVLSKGPIIAVQPQSQSANAGSEAVLTVEASGNSALSYVWYHDAAPLTGQTGTTLALTNLQAADAGAYYVAVEDSSGKVTASAEATLTIVPSTASIITGQPASQTIAVGGTVVFSVTLGGAAGASSPAKADNLLASANTLAFYQWQFNGVNLTDRNGISGSAGPQLVIQGATAANEGTYACIVTIADVSTRSDSAGLLIGSASNSGHLISLSARGYVGSGGSILIGGFFIAGSTSRTVLIQALGPALSSEGVSGALQHPALSIDDSSGATIYSNTGWGSSPVLLNAAAAAYANPVLQPNSGDSELLLTLPPGGYTAEISGADGGMGVALCTVYELP
jgi:sugar lactone lactonase YvrE